MRSLEVMLNAMKRNAERAAKMKIASAVPKFEIRMKKIVRMLKEIIKMPKNGLSFQMKTRIEKSRTAIIIAGSRMQKIAMAVRI